MFSCYYICSRRESKFLLQEIKIVSIKGLNIESVKKVNPHRDIKSFMGKILNKIDFRSLFLTKKPIFFINSCAETEERKTILDFLQLKYQKGFFLRGSLNYSSREKLLIYKVNISCQLGHQKLDHQKKYKVKSINLIEDKKFIYFKDGIKLNDKLKNLCSIKIIKKILKYTILKLIFKERIIEQIKRLVSLLGYKFLDFKKASFGNISLKNLIDKDLKLLDKFKFKDFP